MIILAEEFDGDDDNEVICLSHSEDDIEAKMEGGKYEKGRAKAIFQSFFSNESVTRTHHGKSIPKRFILPLAVLLVMSLFSSSHRIWSFTTSPPEFSSSRDRVLQSGSSYRRNRKSTGGSNQKGLHNGNDEARERRRERRKARNDFTHGIDHHDRIESTNPRLQDGDGFPSDELYAPFPAAKALLSYMKIHSQQALISTSKQSKADNTSTRKYAVAYYWCPHRAGAMLPLFLSSVAWAIIHNRTILWLYFESPENSDAEKCSEVIQRAPWLPSYLEWKDRLNLPDPIPVKLSAKAWEEENDYQVVMYPQIKYTAEQFNVTNFSGKDHPFKTDEYRKYIKRLPKESRSIASDLYSEGYEFLYGMLITQIFRLNVPPSSIVTEGVVGNNKNKHNNIQSKVMTSSAVAKHNGDPLFSVAMHSRHPVLGDDGSFLRDETQCLEKVLNGHEGSCKVYLMSDRPKTISLLTNWIAKEKQCIVVTANRTVGKHSRKEEHGPWAGVGFWEDLDVVSQARDGLVAAPERSSTSCLRFMMEYRRRISAWRMSGNAKNFSSSEKVAVGDIGSCDLPIRNHKGYDYGPGTPTFRIPSYLYEENFHFA